MYQPLPRLIIPRGFYSKKPTIRPQCLTTVSIIHVTITVAPDSSSAFLSALASLLDQMEKERESTYFEVSQNPEQAGQFRLVENWACDKKRMIEISLRDHTCVAGIIGACFGPERAESDGQTIRFAAMVGNRGVSELLARGWRIQATCFILVLLAKGLH